MNGLFILLGRVMLATAQVKAYVLIFVMQVIWYLVFRQPVKIGDAAGELGRGSVDAVVGISNRR
jgi:hypothetical protein